MLERMFTINYDVTRNIFVYRKGKTLNKCSCGENTAFYHADINTHMHCYVCYCKIAEVFSHSNIRKVYKPSCLICGKCIKKEIFDVIKLCELCYNPSVLVGELLYKIHRKHFGLYFIS